MTYFKIVFSTVSVHQIRNFGETLYVEFRDDRKANISLSEVGQATDTLVIEVFKSKKNLRRVGLRIEQLLKQELLLSRSTVELVDTKLG